MRTIIKILIVLILIPLTGNTQIKHPRGVKFGNIKEGRTSDSILVWRGSGNTRVYHRSLSSLLSSSGQTLSLTGQLLTISGSNGNTITLPPTPGINDVLSQNQDLTDSRNLNLNGNTFAFLAGTSNFFINENSAGFNGLSNFSTNVGSLSINSFAGIGSGDGAININSSSSISLNSTDLNSTVTILSGGSDIILNSTDFSYTGKVSLLNITDDNKAFRYNLSTLTADLVFSDPNDIPNKKYVDEITPNSLQLTPVAKSSIVSPLVGTLIIDSEEGNKLKFYDGTNWQEISFTID